MHHDDKKMLGVYCSIGTPLPKRGIPVPLCIDSEADPRFGDFAVDEIGAPTKRLVRFLPDNFAKLWEDWWPREAGHVERTPPTKIEVATDRLPHWAAWVPGYEYFFKATWELPNGSHFLYVRPGRDGSLSFTTPIPDFIPKAPRDSGSEHRPGSSGDTAPTTTPQGDASGGPSEAPRGSGSKPSGKRPQDGGVGIAAAQAARWQEGRLARGWKARRFFLMPHGHEPSFFPLCPRPRAAPPLGPVCVLRCFNVYGNDFRIVSLNSRIREKTET